MKISRDASKAAYPEQHTIDVGDVPGHQIRIYSVHRVYNDKVPADCHGLKRKESWAYGQPDYVNRNGSTSGYGIVNLSTAWQATPKLQLAAGVDNVFDKKYRDHLGGYNRVMDSDVAVGARLPGYGVNAFARLVYEF